MGKRDPGQLPEGQNRLETMAVPPCPGLWCRSPAAQLELSTKKSILINYVSGRFIHSNYPCARSRGIYQSLGSQQNGTIQRQNVIDIIFRRQWGTNPEMTLHIQVSTLIVLFLHYIYRFSIRHLSIQLKCSTKRNGHVYPRKQRVQLNIQQLDKWNFSGLQLHSHQTNQQSAFISIM